MNCKRLQIFSLVFGLLALLCMNSARAQSPARLDGVVQDQTHAVVPGAKVQIVNNATGVVTTATSNATGQYVFPFVLPGHYALSAARQGFKKWETTVDFNANAHVTVNITLTVGAITQSVRVGTNAAGVQTDSGQRSETLTGKEIQNTATIGTNAEQLMTLLPGVTQGGSSAYGANFTPNLVSSATGVEGFNINGNRSDANTFKLDGGNMDDLTGNNGSIVYPNTQFISEMTIETSNYTADQGGSPILITAVTKSGTKHLHGEAFWTGRNYAFDANDWSNNYAHISRPTSRFNYPGFDVGGPILLPWTHYNRGSQKKLFFFVGIQWNLQKPDEGTQLADVPTAGMLKGDFSDIVNSSTCVAARNAGTASSATYLNQPCEITDPATGKTLDEQGGKLSTFTPDGVGLLRSLLGPGLAGANYKDPNGKWNYAAHPIFPHNVTQYIGRFDWDPSDKARMFIRLGKQDESLTAPWGEYSGENSTWTSNVPDPTPTIQQYNSRSLSFNMVSVLSPSMTNEFTFNTNALVVPARYQNPSLLSKSTLGVSFNGVFNNGYPIVPQIVPNFGVCDSLNESGCEGGAPGEGRWGSSNLVGMGNYYKQTQFSWGDNLTKVIGAHDLKFGGLIGRARNDQNESGLPLEGQLVTSNWTAGTSGDEYADILTEHFAEYVQANHDVRGNLRASSFEWYGQDSWKVRKNLTVDYGIRWTLQGPWYEARGLGSTFDPAAYNPADRTDPYNGIRTASCSNPGQSAVALCGTIPKTIRPYGHPLTQPRIGFAWDPESNGRYVLRGGFGVYTQRDPTNAGFGAILGPPNLQEATICCSMNLSQIAASKPSAQGAFTYSQSSAVYSTKDNANPNIYQYNLTLSRRLPDGLFAQIGYVGSQSRHLQIEQNIDSIPQGKLWLPGGHLVDPALTGQEGTVAPYAPFAQISQIQHSGNANYNALQMSLRRRASRRLAFIASYTYSKAMGDSDQYQTLLPDPFSTKNSKHVLSFDRTNVFSIAYQYFLPGLPHGASRLARGLVNGWMLSGITQASSGGPFAISAYVNCVQMGANGTPSPAGCSTSMWSASDTWFGTNAWTYAFLPGSTTSPPNGIYPTYTCDPRHSHGNINTAFVNTSCITLPKFGEQGAIDPPYMKNPGSVNFDLSMQKSFAMGSGRHLDIRAAAFDLANRAQPNAVNNVANFNWVLPYGATDPDQGTAVLTNGSGSCTGGTIPLGYSCGKTGYRQMEGSVKFFF